MLGNFSNQHMTHSQVRHSIQSVYKHHSIHQWGNWGKTHRYITNPADATHEPQLPMVPSGVTRFSSDFSAKKLQRQRYQKPSQMASRPLWWHPPFNEVVAFQLMQKLVVWGPVLWIFGIPEKCQYDWDS